MHQDLFTNDLYKHAIAKRAANLIEDGDIVFINTASTALLLLKYLKGVRCTIFTNNGKAIGLDLDPNIQIVITGGELRNPKDSMVGEFAINTLKKVNANKCFLGCNGITAESGITTEAMPETTINETMLLQTRGKRYILCDHSKIGIQHRFNSGDISLVDSLITDYVADKSELRALADKGVEIISVEPLTQIPDDF